MGIISIQLINIGGLNKETMIHYCWMAGKCNFDQFCVFFEIAILYIGIGPQSCGTKTKMLKQPTNPKHLRREKVLLWYWNCWRFHDTINHYGIDNWTIMFTPLITLITAQFKHTAIRNIQYSNISFCAYLMWHKGKSIVQTVHNMGSWFVTIHSITDVSVLHGLVTIDQELIHLPEYLNHGTVISCISEHHDRRKFRSQTSDNMERWKSTDREKVRREKMRDGQDQRERKSEERRCRCVKR